MKIFLPILISLLILAGTFFLGAEYGARGEINKCQAKESKFDKKEIESKGEIIVIKKKQIEVLSQPDDAESRKRFVRLWREERFGNDK